jgi:glycosyltransferase involved in cell wall biosynthesis
MKIGVVPDLRTSAGGIYQYSITILNALREWTSDGSLDQFVILTEDRSHPLLQEFREPTWTVDVPQPHSYKKTAKRVLTRFGLDALTLEIMERFQSGSNKLDVDRVQSRPHDKQWLQSLGIELMLYPTPQARSFEIGLPYMMAIHDLQHRLQPEFPEVSANGEWNYREYLFRNGARHALMVLTDSEVGKEDVLNFYGEYGVQPDRVKVLPFLPASYLPSEVSADEQRRVRRTYNLPERFLFYPAQFWPHKNHARIIRALGLVKEQKIEPPIVFCGSSEGSIRRAALKEVMKIASENRVTKQILNLGYVPDDDMAGLYAAAAALVMPTFFGPTNIPVLEAWRFGCPVITSDIRGIREQVGNAAVLVDPKSVEAIADGIQKIWTDAQFSLALAANGRHRLSSYTPADFRNRLVNIIEEAKAYGIC